MKKRIFDNKELTAAAMAEEIYRKTQENPKDIYIALSGGSTPALLFSILAKDYGKRINWKLVHIFWVDERSVPPEDDQSNYKMTSRTLLDFIKIPKGNIFRIHGEVDTYGEAKRYSEIIRQTVPQVNGIPVFDMILLGIGDDGHTASIFPDQMELLQSRNICEKAIHPQSGQKRVTLTGNVINKGKSVYFLVCGNSKRDIMKKIVQKSPQYPASFIQNDGELFFYLDRDAAEFLE